MKNCRNCWHFVDCTDAHSNILPYGYCSGDKTWKKVDAMNVACEKYSKQLTLQEMLKQEEIKAIENQIEILKKQLDKLKTEY